MYILIAVIALVALPFIVALFVKKEYALERSVVIDRPNQEVFNYLTHIAVIRSEVIVCQEVLFFQV